jgi:hypothetical protein
VGLLGRLACVIALTACGGQSERTDPDTGGSDRAELEATCGDLAEAMCTRRDACHSPSAHKNRYLTHADCVERQTLECTEWADLPATNVTASNVSTCAAEIAAATCGDIGPLFYSWVARFPFCLPAGTRPDGDPCASDAQCAGRSCPNSYAETCSICETPEEWRLDGLREGDPCTPGGECNSPLACENGFCTLPLCETPGCNDFGYFCTGNPQLNPEARNCELGTECSNANDMGRGQCIPYAADGEPCDTFTGPQCQSPAGCIDGWCRLPTERDCR